MSLSQLTSWPPSQSTDQIEKLKNLAITYALSNSLILKPSKPILNEVNHAPFCLFPSPFPKDEFEKSIRIQISYNKLYAKIASSPKFIQDLIGKSVSKVDPFIGRLYSLWDRIHSNGLGSKIALGIFRSDYLLHHQDLLNQTSKIMIKQVEFNTVSVSFGALGTKVSDLHRYLTTTTDTYSKSQLPQPINHGLSSLSNGLAIAHQTYISLYQPKGSAIILMITQPDERNLFDQALLLHALAEEKGIRMIRLSCHEILNFTDLDQSNSTLYYLEDGQRTEVSLVYYRCMYGPEDFKTEEDWKGRERLECSRSINCPNLATQLAGCKKIQQVLTDSNLLKTHQLELDDILSEVELDELRSTWMPIFALDDHAVKLASDPITAARFVLKPQREGGGHNIYGHRIPEVIKKMRIEERDGYILMELIQTPKGIHNHLIRPEESLKEESVEVISELGVLGVCLFKSTSQGKLEVIWNTEAGHLLRTKNSESDEGGVAVGISCLDSPYLV
ncbi:glutathione synthase [Melampsora americana]|nr:glutathione synthase [Melampsora americana]